MPDQFHVVSSTSEPGGLKITFRSAEEIQQRNEEQKSIPNSVVSNHSACALHPADSSRAFLDPLPTPPPAETQGSHDVAETAKLSEKIKKD